MIRFPDSQPAPGLSRRRLLGTGALAAGALAAGPLAWARPLHAATGTPAAFDAAVKAINVDYTTKRRDDLGMGPPTVTPLPIGILRWLPEGDESGEVVIAPLKSLQLSSALVIQPEPLRYSTTDVIARLSVSGPKALVTFRRP